MIEDNFVTKDIGLAACLLTNRISIKRLHWKDKTAFFVFAEPAKALEIQSSYFNSVCMVDARTYHDNLKNLKAQIMERVNNGRR